MSLVEVNEILWVDPEAIESVEKTVPVLRDEPHLTIIRMKSGFAHHVPEPLSEVLRTLRDFYNSPPARPRSTP